jgi:hypothetical protein
MFDAPYGTSVEPHHNASPSGTNSTGVGTTPKTARTKQMVAMTRKSLLGFMGIFPFPLVTVACLRAP